MMDERHVRAYMDAHGMLPPKGGRVLVACSGGADSTALLHLLHGMAGIDAVCAHFNHCLRGTESDRDEAFVRELCARFGMEFYAGRGDAAAHAAARRLGLEDAARELRYAFLERAAAETGCARIATAHTADDNAETVLLRLARGAGTRGLCGIPPIRTARGTEEIRIIRPLLRVTRAEIEDYLALHGLPHVEDSSNRSDDYARNYVRHAVLPALRRLNPGVVNNICSAAELLREDEEFLNERAEQFLRERDRDGALPVPALLALPKPVAMRALRAKCGGPSRVHLEAVYAMCRSDAPRGAADIPGLRVTRERDRLIFGPLPPAEPIPRREIRPGEALALPEIGKMIRCTEEIFAGDKEIYSSFNTFYFQSEKICDKITVASRAPGDKIRLAGRGCTKSLKKLFSESGLSPAERARTPVFSDGAGVIAVAGFGIAERCVPERGKQALKIEILA